MPAIESIEYEKVSYIKEMENYLQDLKNMQKSKAREISLENLVKSEIITESGDFTEHYEFTKKYYKRG